MPISTSQRLALAVAPKVGGVMSVGGSLWIVVEISSLPRQKRQVYHRLLCMMSAVDIIVSTAAFCSTWPMTTTADNDNTPYDGLYKGTTATCAVQGFAMQLGATLFTYNAALSAFYVLLISYQIKEQKLTSYEYALHGIPLLFGLTTAAVAASLQWYHNANLWCWIAVAPECEGNDNADADADAAFDCDRYQHIWIFRWAFFFAPLWACFAVQTCGMFVVARSVHRQEAQVEKYLQPQRSFMMTTTANQTNNNNSQHGNSSQHGSESQRQLPRIPSNTCLSPGQTKIEDDNDDDEPPTQSAVTPSTENNNSNPQAEEEGATQIVTSPRSMSFRLSLSLRRNASSADHVWRTRQREFKRTKQVATQAILYICAFYFTYFFATLNRILQQVQGSSPFVVLFLHSLTLPQQGYVMCLRVCLCIEYIAVSSLFAHSGFDYYCMFISPPNRFWNFLIYRRPYYLQLRRQQLTRWQAVCKAVTLSWFRRKETSTSRMGSSRGGFRSSLQRNSRISKRFSAMSSSKPVDVPEEEEEEEQDTACVSPTVNGENVSSTPPSPHPVQKEPPLIQFETKDSEVEM